VRFVDDLVPRTADELYSNLATEASVIERWQLALGAGQRALELWREVGDPARVSEAMRSLSATMWRLCRGTESMDLAIMAVDIVRDSGVTSELARAYAHLVGECGSSACAAPTQEPNEVESGLVGRPG
jgi:hypothetical protein